MTDEHLDVNGHMNIRWYFEFGGTAMWQFSQKHLGMGASYIDKYGMTTFTAEQHLRYFAEARGGDRLAVRTVPIDRGDKAIHLGSFILNDTRKQLACVMESVLVHVDFTTRRPAPFPAEVAAEIDAQLGATQLDAALPLSGAVGIRR